MGRTAGAREPVGDSRHTTEESVGHRGHKCGNSRRELAWGLKWHVGLMKMFLNRKDPLDVLKVIKK